MINFCAIRRILPRHRWRQGSARAWFLVGKGIPPLSIHARHLYFATRHSWLRAQAVGKPAQLVETDRLHQNQVRLLVQHGRKS